MPDRRRRARRSRRCRRRRRPASRPTSWCSAARATTSPTTPMNRVFRRLMDGAALVGMHRNLYWRTAEGWQLDGGAYLAGLEAAAGVDRRRSAASPRPRTSRRRSSALGVAPGRALMVGDDIVNDVLGAQARGHHRACRSAPASSAPSDLERGEPDHVIDALADLPALLAAAERCPTGARRRRSSRGIAPQYSWMGAVMSFGQDGRWRRAMVSHGERGAGPVGARRRRRHRSRLARAGGAQARPRRRRSTRASRCCAPGCPPTTRPA